MTRYRNRLSGPILDRVDLHLAMPRLAYDKLTAPAAAETSLAVRARVVAARERQWRRFAEAPVTCNAEMGLADVRAWCGLDSAGVSLVRAAVQRLGLSARAYYRVLRLARTIADLAGSDAIAVAHVAEAIQYQSRSHDC